MDSLLRDVRFALRSLWRTPGFALAAVLSLALGLGGNTMLFSVVDAALMRPLPYPEADRLVQVWSSRSARNVPRGPSTLPDFQAFRDESGAFEGAAAYWGADRVLSGGAEPEAVRAVLVSPSFFQVLRVPPALGRGFTPDEETYGQHRVAVISSALAQRRFGGGAAALGQPLVLGGETFLVVGVMPPGFRFPERDADLWLPLSLDPSDRVFFSRTSHFLRVVARLAPGATVDSAQAAVGAIAQRHAQQFPESAGLGATIVSLRDQLVGDVRTGLWVLLGAVGFVLLIACANLANLLLARGTARQRELAIRAAMGATRGQVVRQLLVESVLLALVGGAAGVLCARWGLDGLMALAADSVALPDPVRLDLRVLGFALLLSLLTGVGFGLAPALMVSRIAVADVLKGSSSGRMGGAGRLRALLVVVEVALSLVLLVGAGLLLRSFQALQQVELGLEPDGVLTAQVSLPQSRYVDAAQVNGFARQVLERLAALPGVERVALASSVPLGGGRQLSMCSAEGQPPAASVEQVPIVETRVVGGDYQRALGVQLRQGRFFGPEDAAGGQKVAVLNEAAARQLFPGKDAVGQRLWMGPPEKLAPAEVLERLSGHVYPRLTVVGVTRDVRTEGQNEPARAEVLMPLAQADFPVRRFWLGLRTAGEPRALVPSVRRAVAEADPEQPITDVRTMAERLEETVAQPRFRAVLLGLFAAVALVLAAVGVHGVLSYSVAQRTHELGVRMALGAAAEDVVRLVVRQGLVLVGVGVALGLAGAVVLARVASSLLFEVSAVDPLTYGAVVAVLAAVALVALYAPARRASRVDPMESLRAE